MRRKTMTYSKPEVHNFASAVGLIQGTGKPFFSTQDQSVAPPYPNNAQTMGAYESDE
jgi:hypothetical protein